MRLWRKQDAILDNINEFGTRLNQCYLTPGCCASRASKMRRAGQSGHRDC